MKTELVCSGPLLTQRVQEPNLFGYTRLIHRLPGSTGSSAPGTPPQTTASHKMGARRRWTAGACFLLLPRMTKIVAANTGGSVILPTSRRESHMAGPGSSCGLGPSLAARQAELFRLTPQPT